MMPHANGNETPSTDEQVREGLREGDPWTTAVSTLLQVHRPWMLRWTACRGRRAQLPRDDIQDFQQLLFFYLLEALEAYRQLPPPQRCRFPTFLGRVLRQRFLDFVKRQRRLESHLDRTVQGAQAIEAAQFQAATRNRQGGWPHLHGDDPCLLLQVREMQECYERALGQLQPQSRLIWEEYLDGIPVQVIARRRGVLEYRVRYLLDKIRVHLREKLHDWET
jgi:RNA polymerase sigma factor (sigma-70 family)